MGGIADPIVPLSQFETVETRDSQNETLMRLRAIALCKHGVDGVEQRVGRQGLAQERLKAELSPLCAVL
jgi:hypothetical protein